VQWRSAAIPPDPAIKLGMAIPPGPRTGRIRLTVDGEVLIMGIMENSLAAAGHLHRVGGPYGLIVCSRGEDAPPPYPWEQRRRSHQQFRGTAERALDVLYQLRETKDLIFFDDWARAVYESLDGRQPDARELAHIQNKAFRLLRDLE